MFGGIGMGVSNGALGNIQRGFLPRGRVILFFSPIRSKSTPNRRLVWTLGGVMCGMCWMWAAPRYPRDRKASLCRHVRPGGHDRQRLRPIFVVEALCKAGAGIKGRCRGPRSSPSCSGGDVVEGARASVPLAADLSSESPLTRTL